MITLGLDDKHQTRVASDEHHVVVYGPPRSGKTSGIFVPSLLTHHGPAVVASSKPDVLHETMTHRQRVGPVWVFSLAEMMGVKQVAWSPLPGCDDWDQALFRARTLTVAGGGVQRDDQDRFWRAQAERVIAAVLHAAALAEFEMEDVVRWIMSGDLSEPAQILTERNSYWSAQILTRLVDTDDRLKDSVLVTAADTLRVYDATTARVQAEGPLLPIDDLLSHNGTLYLVAPAAVQEMFAPLVVGVLEAIKELAYRNWRSGSPSLLLALDETANIAPLPGLGGILAEGGSQGVQLLACFQDHSQAKARWGTSADGFFTLFRHKVLLPGIADSAMLSSLSGLLGESQVPGISHLQTRPTWPAWRLATPPAGQVIHIDGARASQLTLIRPALQGTR